MSRSGAGSSGVFSVSSTEELGVCPKTEESLKDFQQDIDTINKISKNLGGWQEPESMCWQPRQFRDDSKKLSWGYLGKGRNAIVERWFQVARFYLISGPRLRVEVHQGMSRHTEEEQAGSVKQRKYARELSPA